MKRLPKISISGKWLAISIMLALLLFSCRKGEESAGIANLDDFISRQDAGLFGDGGFLFKYTPQECQISTNIKRHQIRLQNDPQTSWLHIGFAQFPRSEGEKIGVELKYRVGGDEIVNVTVVETVKVRGEKYWLWDSKNNLGVILPHCW